MKKVFVITFSDVADFESYPKGPSVFEKKEDALSAMKSYKEDFLKETDVKNDTKDGADNDETENQYIMKACFSNNNDSIIIRIYYGNVTEEIGYVDVVEIAI